MEMDERKYKILQAIIEDYILTAMPVGSRTISRKYVGLSSATIRNEMSDLEEMGLLDQPHTSSGRVPSQKAYRLYVDHLMKVSELSQADADQIKGFFSNRMDQIDEVIRCAAQVLSDVTHYTSVIMAPHARQLRIKHIQLVPMADNSALAIVVTDSGHVRDALIRIPDDIDRDQLGSISNMLTERFYNRELQDIDALLLNIREEMTSYRHIVEDAFQAFKHQLTAHKPDGVIVGGTINILNYPEYNDMQKARSFLAVLEARDKLYQILKNTGQMELTIRIGNENEVPEMQDCSVVTATYHIGDGSSGSIGVIGPTRMNYSKVLSVLDFMGKSLGEIISGMDRRL